KRGNMNLKKLLISLILFSIQLFSNPILPLLYQDGEDFNTTQDFFIDKRNPVNAVDISHNDRYIVSASDDNNIRLWDRKSGRLLKLFRGHCDRVLAVKIS
ncbi:MAG: hypothetical protein KAU90_03895, partial [Sulfurovaceae bacterium]|nr:hypothetical protein [Sulfurovaceae bacterium]